MRAALLLLAACGRIGFDPSSAADGAIDDGIVSDGALQTGLLLHLTFDAGHTDLRGHTVTCLGCPGGTNDARGGTAANFSGGQCLVIDEGADLRVAQFTLAMRLKPRITQAATAYSRPLQRDPQRVSRRTWITATDRWTTFVDTNGVGAVATIGAWQHVAGVYDGSMLRIYVDGAFKGGLRTPLLMYAEEDELIGCDRDTSGFISFFDGAIDDVRLYDRVLTAAELAALAQ